LPLILTDSSAIGIPFLDTTQIHVRAILEQALAGKIRSLTTDQH
jgi:aspartate/glutamate racemase